VSEIRDLLQLTADLAGDYLETLDERPVLPAVDGAALREALGGPLPEGPEDPRIVVSQLAAGASPGIAGIPSGRWFGFVMGGGVPAALGADWLTSAWDQNAGLFAATPAAAVVEEVAGAWLRELLGIPPTASFGFVTGCQMAHVTALAAARHHLLNAAGWDLARDGLYGAPRIRVVAGAKRHVTLDFALRLLGMGAPELVAADDQGRMRVDELEVDDRPTIVCAQVGEVNTGACDDVTAVRDRARDAWLHVDGAFGLFARVTPRAAHLAAGVERAHSVIADAHKWLNVAYDSGFAFVRDASLLDAAFAIGAPYLPKPGEHPMFGGRGPEASRRARGIAVWATLRAYGRAGHRAMVERHLDLAQRLARAVDAAPELERLADVPLNIVCFRYRPGDLSDDALDTLNAKVGADLLADGRVYVGTTRYRGRVAFRPAIVNWRTTEADIDLIVEVVRELGARLGVTVA
jgi:glutamate/tyrosine decarboxylase-like PLP-dependent enzyme